jgi:hypothetical protein
MMDQHHTSPKGMNTPNKVVGKQITAKERGMVTDGVDLKKGYKVVRPEGQSRGAYSVENKSDNMKHRY